MFASEKFFFSVVTDRAGVHVLLWEDKNELVRALLVLNAVMQTTRIQFIAVSGEESDINHLIQVIDARRPNLLSSENDDPGESENPFLVLLFQQASSQSIGPWLNGWRNPLSESPGSLLVIRSADFGQFQRNAPDLSSYVGPKLLDSSSMISHFSPEILSGLCAVLAPSAIEALQRLPGVLPTPDELEQWIRFCRLSLE